MNRWLRGPGLAVVLTLAGATLGLLSTARPWVRAIVEDPVVGRATITASGRQAAPVVPAVALVALAGGVALLLARTLGRRVTGVLLVLAGAAGVAATLTLLRTPLSGVSDQVARAVGVSGSTPASTHVTAWPWVAVAGGVLVVVAGVLAVTMARVWAAPRDRYDVPAEVEQRRGADGDGAPDDPGATWDALSRGEDPTR